METHAFGFRPLASAPEGQKRFPIGSPRVGGDMRAHAFAQKPAQFRQLPLSSGRPLDRPTREFFDHRFDFDFSRVRIHTDGEAALSADALGARAYAAGEHIAFGRNEYAPHEWPGRFLLAHELAHVVQQRDLDYSSRHDFRISTPGERSEQEADAAAGIAVFEAGRPSLQPIPEPLIQCSPRVTTWAGTFTAEQYAKYGPAPGPSPDQQAFGANITIVFEPNDKVEANNIALVQTSRVLVDGAAVVDPKLKDEIRQVQLNRMVTTRGSSAFGKHIDAEPPVRTPVAGAANPPVGSNDPSGSVPGPDVEIGFHFSSVKVEGTKWVSGFIRHPAVLTDRPRWFIPKGSSGSMLFETEALALGGQQKGAYYGGVKWGWRKEPFDATADLEPFGPVTAAPGHPDVAKQAAPSSDFWEAVKKWNTSTSSANAAGGKPEQDIPLTEFRDAYTTSPASALLDQPEKGKNLGPLAHDTHVAVMEEPVSETHGKWSKIVVIDGTKAGTVGWVKSDALVYK